MNSVHGTRYGPDWPPRLIWGRMGRARLIHAYQPPANGFFDMRRWGGPAADNNWDYAYPRLTPEPPATQPRAANIQPVCRRTQPNARPIYPPGTWNTDRCPHCIARLGL